MTRTKHFVSRINERQIKEEVISMVFNLGTEFQDGKIVLSRKAVVTAMNEVSRIGKVLQQVNKRNGIVVVEVMDHLITAYPIDKKQKKRPSRARGKK